MRDPFVRTLLAGMILGAAACARQGAPSGGVGEQLPPFVIATVPDTFAVLERVRGPVVLRFQERISERAAEGTLEQAVLISPEPEEVRVRHRRRSLEVTPVGGFRSGVIYRITLLPVVRDLFGSRMEDPFELVFSTGPAEFPETVLAAVVHDRITGDPVEGYRVESSAPDSLRYVGITDGDGIAILRFLPPGGHQITAYLDRNRNRIPDFTEPQGRVAVELAPSDTVVMAVPVLQPDTTPAVLTRVEPLDSLSIRLAFDDYLDPARPPAEVGVRVLQDSIPLGTVRGVFHRFQLDSLLAVEGAAATEEEPEFPEVETGPDGLPLPARELFILLSIPLLPELSIEVEVEGVTNISGVTGGGGSGGFVVEPPPEPEPEEEVPETSPEPGGEPPDTPAATGAEPPLPDPPPPPPPGGAALAHPTRIHGG